MRRAVRRETASRSEVAQKAPIRRVVENEETLPRCEYGDNSADAGGSAPDSGNVASDEAVAGACGEDAHNASRTAGPDAQQLVLERLLAAHEAWFDVSRDYGFAGRTFAGYAEFHSHGEQYVLVKRAKLWEVDTHEYLFLHRERHLDARVLANLVSFMETEALGKVDPKPNHMTSFLSLVVIADTVDDDARRAVRKVRFRKNFKWGLRGWADLRLAVADLSRGDVVSNAAGKALDRTIEANLAL